MGDCRNVGSIDRIVRAIVGVVSLGLAFAGLGVMEGELPGVAAAALGVVMLGTALLGMCPLYLPFKVSTCKPGRP